MIKITQNEVTKNFLVTVSKFETVKETFKIANQVQRILAKSGVVSVSTSTKSGEFVVDFSSYDDTVSVDIILWVLVDTFNVGYGYWDHLGIYTESCFSGNTIQTNKDGSTIKVSHKNAYRLRGAYSISKFLKTMFGSIFLVLMSQHYKLHKIY